MKPGALIRELPHSERASELVEFAVCLPLLVVLVVGIYDFGSAFTVKHKLSSAVAEAARAASNQSYRDFSVSAACGAPASVCVLRDVVVSSLQQSGVEDCGLGTSTAVRTSFAWTFQGACPATLTLVIDRGGLHGENLADPFQADTQYLMETTRVTLTYPYQWQFNRVARLLVSSATGPTTPIAASAETPNLN